MSHKTKSILDPKKRYLQVALNSTLEDAREIIGLLPSSDRIIVEAGTPLIKRYGAEGIRQIRRWYEERLRGGSFASPAFGQNPSISDIFKLLGRMPARGSENEPKGEKTILPYVVADLKTMDRGETEVEMAAEAGASAVVALGSAPIETLNSFVAACEAFRVDAMIDMMHVEFPLSVLRALKKVPQVAIIHRGVDEERFNKEKQIPLHEIRRIKGAYDIMISIAGGDTLREVQRSIFNDADIVVIWKSVFQKTEETVELINGFLKEIK